MSSEIIRCIDCEFYKKPKGAGCGYCEHGFMEIDIADNDFCSRAEARSPDTSMFVEPEVKTNAKVNTKFKLKDGALKADFMTCGSPTTNITHSRNTLNRLSFSAKQSFVQLAESASASTCSHEELTNALTNAWRNRLCAGID